MTLFLRLMLFLSSYVPLAVILFILYLQSQPILAWVALGLGLVGLFALLIYLFGYVPHVSPVEDTVTEQHGRGGEVMGYIASYIVPFATITLDGWQQIAALLIFLAMLGIVYINSDDMLRINPMLNVLGYRLYEVSLKHGFEGETYALITRHRITRGSTVRLVALENDIYIEKNSRTNRIHKQRQLQTQNMSHSEEQ